MATELLATGTSAATSSDLVLASGETAVIFLKSAVTDGDGSAVVLIQLKDSGGNYNTVGQLTVARQGNAKLLSGPATYRFSRPLGASVGVERG